jgi:hypothetical protein
MELDNIGAELTRRASLDDWSEETDRLWVEATEQAGRVLSEAAPGAWCTAQEWDRRIDCTLKLDDGRMIGEMVTLADLSAERVAQAGDRLRRYAAGENVCLQNELTAPILLRPAD